MVNPPPPPIPWDQSLGAWNAFVCKLGEEIYFFWIPISPPKWNTDSVWDLDWNCIFIWGVRDLELLMLSRNGIWNPCTRKEILDPNFTPSGIWIQSGKGTPIHYRNYRDLDLSRNGIWNLGVGVGASFIGKSQT